ncbi:alpha/beta hydrolase [Paenibacillus sp. sptzw28]|uniref:poly(ethylene terephthalate) hydrolase family protein n=1 Tax=Paenibacillus sp. sptzw28 TaxID=715179 RepID=UPI001C6F433C|nr:alpha/beta hydrolase [Paenibacillus sp. sptzw28]QYR23310.1 alpha/beta hydrolase [Paenibacillus sp. sptzw28]
MEMDVQVTPVSRKSVLLLWLLGRTNGMFKYDTPFWRISVIGLWVINTVTLITAALGMPTGLGIVFDTVAISFLGTIIMAAAAGVAAFVLSLCYVPLPRFYTGALLYTGSSIYAIWFYADIGYSSAVILSAIQTGAGITAGMIAGLLASRTVSLKTKLVSLSSLPVICLALAYWPAFSRTAVPPVPAVIQDDAETGAFAVAPLQTTNPAEPGPYEIYGFTYGSGEDLHRDEFGRGAQLRAMPVDASSYIKYWPWLRSIFWGFDQQALPLNGHVWMPRGEGPFPLALIVHGNHLMEQFSDVGYAYLGELLASRGIIAVSVDENFLNYSVWTGIPEQDMKARAWILLKHLQQIAEFSGQEGSPFNNRVDLSRVALIGHSRGGQAAAMAADRSRWFASDRSLSSLDAVQIRAVIGIAPTDKTVDKQSAVLKDTYYLTLQGAMDGDVDTFSGERQYIRSSFTPGSERFKASLYIGDANHSRFNTEWGTMDDSLPGGLLLNRRGMMDGSDQREVTKVYVSAFLETALHGNQDYKPLFMDYRSGEEWLPGASYTNRYEDGSFRPIVRFDDDRNKTTHSDGVTAETDGGLLWTEENAEDRDGNGKGTRGAVLQWKDNGGGSFTIEMPEPFSDRLQIGESAAFVFSMTNMLLELNEETAADTFAPPQIVVELESRNGAAVQLPLDRFMPVAPLEHATFTIASWLEKRIKDGKYNQSAEPVFQTYRLPITRFAEENPQFNPKELSRVTFRFSGKKGKVMIDDIGID